MERLTCQAKSYKGMGMSTHPKTGVKSQVNDRKKGQIVASYGHFVRGAIESV